jgi:hypothetical protein
MLTTNLEKNIDERFAWSFQMSGARIHNAVIEQTVRQRPPFRWAGDLEFEGTFWGAGGRKSSKELNAKV